MTHELMTHELVGRVVLVIEDNALNLKLVRDVLAYHGYRVLEATTAEAGLALVRAHLPDLVLMDIRLAGLDGIAALGLLRADPATARIPVVAVTASVMQHDRERFRAAGFDGCIEKPIDVVTFPGQVQGYIDRGRSLV